MKTKIKELVGKTLQQTRVWERALQRWARRGEAIILTYHRVLEKWDRTLDYSQPGMVVTAQTFDYQLHFLKQHFHIVPLSALVNPKSEMRNPKPLCAITFDDGWRDNYDIAFPILRKHEVPATIFLTTDFIGTNRTFWHTRLMYVLLHGNLSDGMQIGRVLQSYPPVVRHRVMALVPMMEPPSARAVDPVIEAVKATCDEETIEELIRDLACACGVGRPLLADRRFFLDWHQVHEMAVAGIAIGSHGCSHRILPRVRGDNVEEEVIRSKAEIEQCIGRSVDHFAFPDGTANQSLIEAVQRAGYASACFLATVPDHGRDGLRLLRRVGMHEGASVGSNGSFSETPLITWLSRAPRAGVRYL